MDAINRIESANARETTVTPEPAEFTPAEQADGGDGPTRAEGRAVSNAGREAREGFQDLAQQAQAERGGKSGGKDQEYDEGDAPAREAISMALTGQTLDELSVQDQANLDILIEEIANGEIRPDFVPATRKGETTLPSGVNGAFVKGTGKGGKDGTVLIDRNLVGKDRIVSVANEEYGEAIAARAKGLGLDVAKGDAGARLATVLGGATLDPKSSDFTARPSDTANVTLGGVSVTGAAAANSFSATIEKEKDRKAKGDEAKAAAAAENAEAAEARNAAAGESGVAAGEVVEAPTKLTVEGAKIWAPSETISYNGADIQVMTEKDLVAKILPHLAAHFREKTGNPNPPIAQMQAEGTAIAERAGRLYGKMIATEGENGFYVFSRDDITLMTTPHSKEQKGGTLQELIQTDEKLDTVIAHHHSSFWTSQWNKLEAFAPIIKKAAAAANVAENDLVKAIDGKMTQVERKVRGIGKAVKGVYHEVKAAAEAGTGILEEWQGELTNNPYLKEHGKAYLKKAKADAKEGGQELIIGMMMGFTGMSEKDAAAAIHKASSLMAMTSHINTTPPDKLVGALMSQFLPEMQSMSEAWQAIVPQEQPASPAGLSAVNSGLTPDTSRMLRADSGNSFGATEGPPAPIDPAQSSAKPPIDPANPAAWQPEMDKQLADVNSLSTYLGKNPETRMDLGFDLGVLDFSNENNAPFKNPTNDFQIRPFVTFPSKTKDGKLEMEVRIRIQDSVTVGGGAGGVAVDV
ncbi:MAG: hypothetical protein WBG95_14385, partial [Sulfitobacter sp.]